jgi:acetolactate synthase-1/3 small subunit
MKEILYIKVKKLDAAAKNEVFHIAQVFGVDVIDYGVDSLILACMLTEHRNDELIALMKASYGSRIEVVRGGAVAIESISTYCR